ncbi:MAG: ABC transporter substrate-binding protein [Actinomycetota bacterium]|nr:ABC transporter substrate-binding protein [Actinomycetota bacterium]
MKIKFPGRSAILIAILGALTLLLTSVNAVPIYHTKTRSVPRTVTIGSGKSGNKGPGKSQVVTTVVGGGGGGAANCGANGGATDTGVTATSIKLGATVVRSGIGSSFLGGSPVAMQAVVDKVNQAGGICGRLLNLEMKDDGWQADRGVDYLRTLIAEGVFALAVSPSSEGVDALIKGGDVDKEGIPLVGADGMVKSEYLSKWVWPVATSTVANMHIMVQQAWKRGLRTFGIVFDKDYHFGVEGAKAFNEEVKRLTKKDIPGFDPGLHGCQKTFCGIQSGQPSYPEVSGFNDSCRQSNALSPNKGSYESCDLVALLLEPKTALTWLANGGAHPGNGRTNGPQPLFNADFAKSCGRECGGLVAWTSFNPPIAPYDDLPAVVDYKQTVRRRDASLDTTNSFTEGSYLGMAILVEALQRVGPHLTRSALKQVLDQGSFDFGLAPALQWRAGDHLGNGKMQAYKFQYSGNSFIAFSLVSGFVKDTSLGKDLGGA